jgi:hypothetical protein
MFLAVQKLDSGFIMGQYLSIPIIFFKLHGSIPVPQEGIYLDVGDSSTLGIDIIQL